MKRRTVLVGAGTMSAVVGGSFFYWPRRWDQIIIHHSAGNHATIMSMPVRFLVLSLRLEDSIVVYLDT